MKFYAALLLLTVGQASAFSAVAPPKASSPVSAGGSSEPVDRSMKGIDSDAAAFDPTSGDTPALSRNNKDQVWVPQVRDCNNLAPISQCIPNESPLLTCSFYSSKNHSVPALVATESLPPSAAWSVKTL